MIEYLFSYGTLKNLGIQKQVFGKTLKMDNDQLPGYELSSTRAYGQYLVIQKSLNTNKSIEGVALEVSTHDLEQADTYEGPEYKRILVNLKSGKEAWVYVAKQP